MKYHCTSCSYSFDEAIGDIPEGIEPGMKIEEIEKCPVCEEYDTFHHVKEEINYVEENTYDPLEIDHFIEAEVEEGRLKVVVGDNIHVMGENHRIAWVGLFDEYEDLIEEKFLEIEEEPTVYFEDFDLDEFEIRIKCTQHKSFGRKFEL